MKFQLILLPLVYLVTVSCQEKIRFEEPRNELCLCENSFLPRLLPSFIVNTILRKCKCKKIAVPDCFHGTYNKTSQSCSCNQCWTGKSCNTMKKKNQPKFTKSVLKLKISAGQLKNSPIASLNDYVSNSCSGDCVCGKTIYVMAKENKDFIVNKYLGEVRTRRNVIALKRYKLAVYSFNEHVYNATTTTTTSAVAETIAPTNKLQITVTVYENSVSKVYSRKRRSVAEIDPELLVIVGTPYLKERYYFDIGDEIVFRVRATLNSTDTTKDLTDVTIAVKSPSFTLSNPVKNDLTNAYLSGNDVIFTKDSLSAGETFYGNITGTVRADVGPLTSLFVDLNATAVYDGSPVTVAPQQSSPIVYTVFPEVNLTRAHDMGVACYSSLDMNMHVNLPDLNYSLSFELTTNIESYVFMAIKNISVDVDPAITFDGSETPVLYSSQGNSINDLATINLGFIKVSKGVDSSERNINIKFSVQVYDHPLVATSSVHLMGVGLQAGPKVLWVEQQNIKIIKNEPTLEIQGSLKHDYGTRFKLGETINVEYTITHTNTSTANAHNLTLNLITEHFELSAASNVLKKNDTWYVFKKVNILNLGDKIIDVVSMKLKNNTTPFQELPITFELKFLNLKSIVKQPVVYSIPPPVAAPPKICLSMYGSINVPVGSRKSFNLEIALIKTVSPIKVELVMPRINRDLLLSITSLKVTNVGSNLVMSVPNYQPKFFSSINYTGMYDQAILDFGTVSNKNLSNTDDSANSIGIEFGVVVNEHENTTNGSPLKVGTGVVAGPYMVWVDTKDLKGYAPGVVRPDLDFIYQIHNSSEDIFQLSLDVSHANSSSQFAYNVSLEFYLTPYVIYNGLINKSEILNTVSDTSFESQNFYFTDKMSSKIQVKLDRSKSAQEGTYQFYLPVRLTYFNQYGKKWQYFKTVNRSIKVLPRFVTIPYDVRKVSQYYGRGFYVENGKSGKHTVYLCMNQHAVSDKSACYYSKNQGAGWRAMDNRLGSIVGHGDKQELIGVSRNQLHYIYYNAKHEEYIAYIPQVKPTALYRDLDDAMYVELKPDTVIDGAHRFQVSNHQYAGAGDGFYYRDGPSKPWILRAKWLQ